MQRLVNNWHKSVDLNILPHTKITKEVTFYVTYILNN